MWALAAAVALGIAPAGAQSLESAAGGGVVRVGHRAVLTLRPPEGVLTAAERAQVANAKIADALQDPTCGAEGWTVRQEDDAYVLLLCSRRVLRVTPADAEIAGTEARQLADSWAEALRQAYTEEKRLAYSSRLLQRAILAVLYPLGFLLLLWLLHVLDRRVTRRLFARLEEQRGLRIGRLRLLASGAERAVLGGVLTVGRVGMVVALAYAFLLGLLRQFPQTAEWAGRLWEPIGRSAGGLGTRTLALIPRILLALLVLALVRLAFRATRQLFEQVRTGRLRMEPILSRENATEAEVAARGVVLVIGLFLIALLVPGQGGTVLLAAFGLLAAAFVLGARDFTADLLGGLSGVVLRTFRTGQRIRCGEVTGVVRTRGLLYTQLEAEDGDLLLLPNQRLLQHPIEVIGRERAMGLLVTLEGEGGAEAATGLFQLAAAACGLKRQDGLIRILAVRGDGLVFRVRWPIAASQDASQARSEYVRALLAKAPGLGLKVTAAETETVP